jgi:hypothetical protein
VLASRLAQGSMSEAQVVAVLRERDKLRLRLERRYIKALETLSARPARRPTHRPFRPPARPDRHP